MYQISKRFSFSASHQLGGLPDDHPCSRLHGHNYEVEVVLSADTVKPPGFVVDYRALDNFKKYLDERFDHRHLNDLMEMEPTAENLAADLYFWCRAQVWGEFVAAVRVSETPKTWAEFRPTTEAEHRELSTRAFVHAVNKILPPLGGNAIPKVDPLARPPADFDAKELQRKQAHAIATALGVTPEQIMRDLWGEIPEPQPVEPTKDDIRDERASWDARRLFGAGLSDEQVKWRREMQRREMNDFVNEQPADEPTEGHDHALSGE